jgi:hypothetical protein
MESTVSGVPQQQKKRPEGHYEGVALLRFLPLGAQFVVCVLLVIFLQGAYTYAQVRTCQPCTSPHLLPFCSTNPVFGWAHHTICRSCSSPLRSSLIGATSTRFYYFFYPTFKCLFLYFVFIDLLFYLFCRWYATVWQGGLYSLFAYTMRRSSGDRGRRYACLPRS